MYFPYSKTSRGLSSLIKLNSNLLSDIHGPPNPNNIQPLVSTMTTPPFMLHTTVKLNYFARTDSVAFFAHSVFPWAYPSWSPCSCIISDCSNSTDTSEPISELHDCKKPLLIYLSNKYLSARHQSRAQ